MQNNLLVAGIACVIAALIGGGLKAFTIEIPVLNSTARQIALGVFGVVLLALGMAVGRPVEPPSTSKPTSPPAVTEPARGGPLKEPRQPKQQLPAPVETHQQPTDQQLVLEKASYRLPDDGIAMNNAKVGPFCCTGEVVVVRSTNGDPAGYVYFFTWQGQAHNVEGGSIVPDLSVLVSGPPHFGDPDADYIKSQITFYADGLHPQSNWTPAGILQYRATVLDFKLVQGPGSKPYFRMGSLKLRIDVRLAR